MPKIKKKIYSSVSSGGKACLHKHQAIKRDVMWLQKITQLSISLPRYFVHVTLQFTFRTNQLVIALKRLQPEIKARA